MKITCLRGFASSGKSTRAAEIAKDTGAVIVNRDLLRLQLLGSYWTGKKQDEERVTIAEEAQVSAFIKAGVDIILDSTHLNPPFLRKWAKLATRMGVEFEVVDIRNDVDWCISADLGRQCNGERHVGPKVIHEQARRWPMHKWPTITAQPFVIEPYVPDVTKPDAILVDLDGTLCHMTGRSPYDYTRVGEDRIDHVVRGLIENWAFASHAYQPHVLLMSGREDSCRMKTLAWLYDFSVPFSDLFMRKAGDGRPDYIVKHELFNQHVRDNYYIEFCLDDRDSVVDMWRRLGLKCLQVAPGDF